MPAPAAISWPSHKAILIVHGIGAATQADLQLTELKIRNALGERSGDFAYYHYAYNEMNQWADNKAGVADGVKGLLAKTFLKENAQAIGDVVGEYLMDVLWPIYVRDIRDAIQTGYIKMLQRMVHDGTQSTNPPRTVKQLELNIVCHSLGCFHTYETLHRLIAEPQHELTPKHGVMFKNVVFMASPVTLIRTLSPLLPVPGELACGKPGHPCDPVISGRDIHGAPSLTPLVKNWVSITGNQDPVGGHLFGEKIDWAYMDLPHRQGKAVQDSHVDDQSLFNLHTPDDWKTLLADIAQKKLTGQPFNDPHSWDAYIDRHANDLKDWMNA